MNSLLLNLIELHEEIVQYSFMRTKQFELRDRVKQLQTELNERTRNYLLHKGLNAPVQTEPYLPQFQDKSMRSLDASNISSNIYTVPLDQGSYSQSALSMRYDQNSRVELSQFIVQDSSGRDRICQLLQQLLDQKKQKRLEDSGKKSIQTRKDQGIREEGWESERKKMKREIKKLRQNIQFQRQVCILAKQGLLISEQENYQFRITLKELNKQTNPDQVREIQTLQQRIQEYQTTISQLAKEKIDLQEKVKAILLQNCELQDKLASFQNSQTYLKSKSNLDTCDPSQAITISHEQFQQILKDRLFTISNTLPFTETDSYQTFFRPENKKQLLQLLTSVQNQCQSVESTLLLRQAKSRQQKRLFQTLLHKLTEQLSKQGAEKVTTFMREEKILLEYISMLAEPTNYECP